MYPSEVEEVWQVESTIDAVEDYIWLYFVFFLEPDGTPKKEEVKAKWLTTAPKWFAAIENRIKKFALNEEGKVTGFICGSKPTIADFALAVLSFNLYFNEANAHYSDIQDIVGKHELLREYCNHFRETYKGYFDSRPQPRPF